jgi:hypothetical protein
MQHETRVVETFPSIRLPAEENGLPVEVSLIAQLGHGAGNHLFASVASRQRQHASFIDELDEPSAKLGATDFQRGDPSALYSFVVGPKGHPFHRHAGHRIFTAVSGSGGAQLRFSTATEKQIKKDPQSFIDKLHYINIPADCLFTVRFGGETWHQFWPLSRNTLHPVFFALSCHTNELGGKLPKKIKKKVLENEADIPSLTELLPSAVNDLLQDEAFKETKIPTTTLALDAPAGTFHRVVCNTVRSNIGLLRGAWGEWYNAAGYISQNDVKLSVTQLPELPEDSLLRKHLTDKTIHHEDTFSLSVTGVDFKNTNASALLADLLEGFLVNAPRGVSRLMAFRNLVVKPMGLRTSPLGCPVSSLLSDSTKNLFLDKYPALDQSISKKDDYAQIILGADDKHLIFRSCVSVKIIDDKNAAITLGTRVSCKNSFGRFYMAVIDQVHRRYISPTMLRRAADYALSGAALSQK